MRPAEIRRNDRRPPVVLTGFQLFNREVPISAEASPLSKHIARSDRVVLSYKQSVMTFEFAALDYTAAEQNAYAYKLDSSTRSGSVGAQRTASYQPGAGQLHLPREGVEQRRRLELKAHRSACRSRLVLEDVVVPAAPRHGDRRRSACWLRRQERGVKRCAPRRVPRAERERVLRSMDNCRPAI